MGDAMSSAILQLFKHSHEVLTPGRTTLTPLDGGTSKRASLQGEELLVFDVPSVTTLGFFALGL